MQRRRDSDLGVQNWAFPLVKYTEKSRQPSNSDLCSFFVGQTWSDFYVFLRDLIPAASYTRVVRPVRIVRKPRLFGAWVLNVLRYDSFH